MKWLNSIKRYMNTNKRICTERINVIFNTMLIQNKQELLNSIQNTTVTFDKI